MVTRPLASPLRGRNASRPVLSSLRWRFGRMVARVIGPGQSEGIGLRDSHPGLILLRFGILRFGIMTFGWCLSAAPVWKAPAEIPFGQLAVLELREDDPALPALPRPAEEKLGPFALRSVEPLSDGRGWRLTVQALRPGMAIIPAMDLGDKRRSPVLKINVPRTVPFGAPWMGVGGGQGDILPYVPFPWAWVSLLGVPPLALALWLVRRWRRNSHARTLHHVRRVFAHHWPPKNSERATLDHAHEQGRDLLAARFGEEARSWGVAEFRLRQLEVWATWTQSLDAARFARKEPPFPPLKDLLKTLEGP